MRASRRCIRMLALLVGCLLLAGGALFLAGCSNLGEFDASAVTRQAERYYERKYGERTKVLDIWEDRSFQLFSDQSSGRAFCTMEDGSTVLVDFEAGVIGDNRQQDEIVRAALPRRARGRHAAARSVRVHRRPPAHQRLFAQPSGVSQRAHLPVDVAAGRGRRRADGLVLLYTLYRGRGLLRGGGAARQPGVARGLGGAQRPPRQL